MPQGLIESTCSQLGTIALSKLAIKENAGRQMQISMTDSWEALIREAHLFPGVLHNTRESWRWRMCILARREVLRTFCFLLVLPLADNYLFMSLLITRRCELTRFTGVLCAIAPLDWSGSHFPVDLIQYCFLDEKR